MSICYTSGHISANQLMFIYTDINVIFIKHIEREPIRYGGRFMFKSLIFVHKISIYH